MEAAAAQFDMKKLQGRAAAASTTTTSVGGSCFKSICVFCGSSSGNNIVHQVARELGTELAQRKVCLVNPGGSIGLMGKIAETVRTGGGRVNCLIPRGVMGHELCRQTIGELIPVDDEQVEMARLADAFIVLPGGPENLQELKDITKWSELCSHSKPVGLLNVNGYFDPVVTLFDELLKDGFLNDAVHRTLVSARTPKELIDKMEEKKAPKLACLGGLFKFYHK